MPHRRDRRHPRLRPRARPPRPLLQDEAVDAIVAVGDVTEGDGDVDLYVAILREADVDAVRGKPRPLAARGDRDARAVDSRPCAGIHDLGRRAWTAITLDVDGGAGLVDPVLLPS
jgi:hypothetical protein